MLSPMSFVSDTKNAAAPNATTVAALTPVESPQVDRYENPSVKFAQRLTKPPAGALRFSTLEFRRDDEVLIGRREIETGPIIGECMAFIFDAERVDDLLPFFPGQGKPSAHLDSPRTPDTRAPPS